MLCAKLSAGEMGNSSDMVLSGSQLKMSAIEIAQYRALNNVLRKEGYDVHQYRTAGNHEDPVLTAIHQQTALLSENLSRLSETRSAPTPGERPALKWEEMSSIDGDEDTAMLEEPLTPLIEDNPIDGHAENARLKREKTRAMRKELEDLFLSYWDPEEVAIRPAKLDRMLRLGDKLSEAGVLSDEEAQRLLNLKYGQLPPASPIVEVGDPGSDDEEDDV